jgi:hypothetical protein
MDATREAKIDLKIIARHFLNTSPSWCGMDAATKDKNLLKYCLK